jgi:hypothetical protein
MKKLNIRELRFVNTLLLLINKTKEGREGWQKEDDMQIFTKKPSDKNIQ